MKVNLYHMSMADDVSPGRMAESSYTPFPLSVFVNNQLDRPSMEKIRQFISERREATVPPGSRELLELHSFAEPDVLPEDHVACIDSLYWVMEDPDRGNLHLEMQGGTGMWGLVGKYMRFQPGLVKLAGDYLLHAFDLPPGSPVPQVGDA